eukprot:1497825-Pleurochrysis_carterae.AAC.3
MDDGREVHVDCMQPGLRPWLRACVHAQPCAFSQIGSKSHIGCRLMRIYDGLCMPVNQQGKKTICEPLSAHALDQSRARARTRTRASAQA